MATEKSLHSICRWTFNPGKGGFVPADMRPQWAGDVFTSADMVMLVKEKIAPLFKGCWSIDFCKAKDGRWILIDMAVGIGKGFKQRGSWHPKTCKKLDALKITKKGQEK